ncbi:hypothetical protein [Streptomyces sp. NPDC020996]|uniref:hypothetical protein n=1 Tax=Streptomyces sp. NPDC020996 TaxID=3154791 RepID=UPI0033C4CD70
MSGSEGAAESAALELLLAAAIRPDSVDAEAEQRAVAAFRAAREAGAHRTRTRRRDDWRPREHGRARRSLKATLALFLAGLTVSGVAVAAIGTAGSSDDDRGTGRPRPSAGAPTASAGPSSAAGSRTPGASAAADRPGTAQDTEAHCRAYESVAGRGRALEATAWQRLIEAAGGEEKVAGYCTRQLAGSTPTGAAGNPGRAGGTGRPSTPGAATTPAAAATRGAPASPGSAATAGAPTGAGNSNSNGNGNGNGNGKSGEGNGNSG